MSFLILSLIILKAFFLPRTLYINNQNATLVPGAFSRSVPKRSWERRWQNAINMSPERVGMGELQLYLAPKPLKNERIGVFRYFFECHPKRYPEGQNGNVLDIVGYFLSK